MRLVKTIMNPNEWQLVVRTWWDRPNGYLTQCYELFGGQKIVQSQVIDETQRRGVMW